jgi:hypothetical protein
MAVHDRWARLTPYELSIPDLEDARERFARLAEEADPLELSDQGRFLVSDALAGMLEALHGERDAERLREHGPLLFHAFHFWRAGEALYLLDRALVDHLVERAPRGWEGTLPSRAGYVQLPQHLVWTDPGGGAVPESVDGFFWATPEGTGQLSLLLVAGIRPDRPGFSVIPLLPAPLAEAADWLEHRGRDDGGDFSSSIPGAELEGLHQLRTAGEVLKLAARTLARLETDPGGTPEVWPGAGPPPPTRLPYRRIELD